MVDFAHGTSPGTATSIVNSGLDDAAGATASAGGRYASPGSFGPINQNAVWDILKPGG